MKTLGTCTALWSLLALGCDSESSCTGQCPVLAGSYAVLTAVPVQTCDFTPYLLGNTLALEQSADGTGATTQVLDPVTQLFTPLSGGVYPPFDDAPSETLGAVVLVGQAVRGARRGEGALLRLQATLNAWVTRAPPNRQVAGSLHTTDLSGAGCTAVLEFQGEEVSSEPLPAPPQALAPR